MSTLYLIRHGQASFGAADYDVLSALGVEQSRRLGAHLAAAGVHLDAIYTGPRRRQIDTAAHVRTAAGEAGARYPAPRELAELDEYPAFELFKKWLPRLRDEEPAIAALAGGGESDPRALRNNAQRALEAVLTRWSRGELDTEGVESFEAFIERVKTGLARIMTDEGRGKRVAVVTSGGPIAAAVKMALALSAQHMLKVAWVTANASLSEFRYRGAEFTLVAFNAMPHLADRALVSYA